MEQTRGNHVQKRSRRGGARAGWRGLAAAFTVAALAVTPVILAPQSSTAAPFPAGAATVYIAQDIPTRLYSAVNVNNQLQFQPVGANSGTTYNALAYHVPTRYLYALSGTNLIRIEDNGAVSTVKTGLITSNAGAFSGEFADRFYYRTAGQLAWYNVVNGISGTTPLSRGFAPVDFAWSNGYFWGLHFDLADVNSNPVMYRMATDGIVTTFPVPGLTRANFVGSNPSFGGAWTYGNGNLGFTNNGGGTVQIAITNAATTPDFEVVSIMDGPASNNNDAAASPGSPIDLSLVKTVDKAAAQVGESLEYTLTVRNETAVSLSSGYTVKDTLPAYLAITPGSLPSYCTVEGSVDAGQAISCAEAPIAGGVSRTITFDVTITSSALRGTTLNNVARVIGNEEDTNAANDVDDASTLVAVPLLALTKTVAYDDANDNGDPDLGEDITWTFAVSNSGDFDATDVSIVDPLVSGITPATLDISQGAVGTFAATTPATQAIIDAGIYTNTATAQGTTAGEPYVTNPSTAELTSRAFPGLQSVKSAALNDANGNGVADAGETIDFTLTVTNTGNVTLTDATASDSLLPLSPAFVATLAPQQTELFTGAYTVTAADVAAGFVQNTASAEGNTPEGTPVPSEPSTTRTETMREGISVVKSAIDPDLVIDTVGEVVDYRFVVTNTGNTTLNNVTITDAKLDAGSLTPASSSIPAGGQFTFTGTHTVTQADIDDPSGRLQNTATATGTPVGNSPITSTPSTVLTPLVEHLPATATQKSAELTTDPNGNGKGDLGDVITYTVTVTNTGNVTVDNVTLNDPMIVGGTAALGSLAPGESVNHVYTHTVTQPDVDSGAVPNAVTTEATDPSGDPVPPSEDETTTPTGGEPLLHAVKSAALNDTNGNGFADEGETISYSVRVWNHGVVTASNVSINDPMAGTFAPAVADIAPGGSMVFTAVADYTVSAADVVSGSVFNSATASGVDPRDPSVPVDSPPTTTETPTPAPQLSVQKSASLNDTNGNGLADLGETISYSFIVANGGNTLIEDIAVTDPKVTGLTPTAFDLPAGRSQLVTADPYIVTDADVTTGTVANSATVTGTPFGGTPLTPPPSTTTTPTVPAVSSFTAEKNAALNDTNSNGFADVGETIAYSFLVTNTGSLTIVGVTVSDPKVTGIAPLTQDVAPGQTIGFSADPYTVTQADVDSGSVLNMATVEGDTPSGNPIPPLTPDSELPTPPLAPDFTATKVATLSDTNSNGYADAGETIVYTVTVENTGNATLSNVTPVDPKLGSVFTPATATLAPRDTQVFTAAPYTVTVADAEAASVVNSATATAENPLDPTTPLETPPTNTSTPTSDPGIAIAKSAVLNDTNGNGLADVGETVGYSFEVSNTGNLPLSNVSVTDPRVSGLTPSGFGVPVGGNVTVTADPYTVTAADVLAGAVNNSAVATGTPHGGTPIDSTPSTTTTPTVAPSSSFTSEKFAALDDSNGNGAADLGEEILYSFVVTNTGTLPLANMTVADDRVTGITPATATIARGASVTFTANSYVVTQADVDAGTVLNVATVTGDTSGGDPLPPQYPESEVPASPAAPALSTVKSSILDDANGNGFAEEGETIDYTVTVRNIGNVTLTDVAPVDAMVAGFTPATAELAPGAEQAFVAEPYTVTAADVTAGVVSNTATSTGTPPGSTPIHGPPSTVTVPTADPGMLIVKSAELNDANGNGVADLGETIDYSFKVNNTGTTVLENVSVVDPKVTGLAPAPVTLPVGESVTFTADPYTVTEQDILAQSIANTAVAEGEVPGGPSFQTPPSTVTVPPAPISAALGIHKSAVLNDTNGNGMADAGESIRFAFVVTNTGNVTQTDVAVQDPMVTGLSSQVIAVLLPGATATVLATPYTVTAKDVAAGGVHNVAAATGTGPLGDPTRSPDASVTVSSTSPAAHRGDVLAQTGTASVWPFGASAAGLLLAGAALMVLRRRKVV